MAFEGDLLSIPVNLAQMYPLSPLGQLFLKALTWSVRASYLAALQTRIWAMNRDIRSLA